MAVRARAAATPARQRMAQERHRVGPRPCQGRRLAIIAVGVVLERVPRNGTADERSWPACPPNTACTRRLGEWHACGWGRYDSAGRREKHEKHGKQRTFADISGLCQSWRNGRSVGSQDGTRFGQFALTRCVLLEGVAQCETNTAAAPRQPALLEPNTGDTLAMLAENGQLRDGCCHPASVGASQTAAEVTC
jgi:hypothetical protein